MSLNLREDVNKILGRKYNVEYEMANGRCATFNNTLVNVDGIYFLVWKWRRRIGISSSR